MSNPKYVVIQTDGQIVTTFYDSRESIHAAREDFYRDSEDPAVVRRVTDAALAEADAHVGVPIYEGDGDYIVRIPS